jgi:hypothetical protein
MGSQLPLLSAPYFSSIDGGSIPKIRRRWKVVNDESVNIQEDVTGSAAFFFAR